MSEGKVGDQSFVAHTSVPQGSICGPLLFIIMTSDMPDAIAHTSTEIAMFADDTKLYRFIETREHEADLQDAIDSIVLWSQQNRFNLNVAKTHHVSFAKKKALETSYYIGEQRIDCVKTVRDLGIIFDDQLTFREHVANISERAMRLAGMGNRLAREIHSRGIILKILRVYITPILEYGANIWGDARKTETDKLERILRIISRRALGTPFFHLHINYIPFAHRMARLKLLTFRQRRTINKVVTAHRLLNSDMNDKFTERLKKCINPQIGRLRNAVCFKVPKRIPTRSPLANLMLTTNLMKETFSLRKSARTIRSELTEIYLSTEH